MRRFIHVVNTERMMCIKKSVPLFLFALFFSLISYAQDSYSGKVYELKEGNKDYLPGANVYWLKGKEDLIANHRMQ